MHRGRVRPARLDENGCRHHDRGHHAPDGRVGDRGNRAGVAQAGRRRGRGRRDAVEVSTDKVDAEVPAPVAGTVAKILVDEGDTVEVGQALAEISTNGAGAVPVTQQATEVRSRAATPCPGRRPARPRPSRRRSRPRSRPPTAPGTGARRPRRPPRPRAPSGKVIDIVTPQAGESVSEGTILRVAQAARGRRGGRRDHRRDLHRQGGRRASRARPRARSPRSSCPRARPWPSGQVIARMAVGEGAAAPAPAHGVAARGQRRARRPRRPPTCPTDATASAGGPAGRRRPGRRPPAPWRAPAPAGASPRPTCSPPSRATARRHGLGRRRRRPPGPETVAQGRRGDARPLHGREPLDPDGDLVPHDHRDGWTRGARS